MNDYLDDKQKSTKQEQESLHKALLSPPSASQNSAELLIRQKHEEYKAAAKIHRALYYSLRLIASLCAGLLPFVVGSHTFLATMLSVAIVVTTGIDMIFVPKDKWQLYSRATDLLTVEVMKRAGNFDQYQSAIDILVATETAALAGLVNMDDLVKKVQNTPR